MFPKDKIQTQQDVFYIGDTPVLSLPRYNHSLKDSMMHVQVMPGKKSEWGGYLLSMYRHNLTPSLDARVYLDYRSKLGAAEGFGLNYISRHFGKGDYKFYYTHERPEHLDEDFQRYLVRWRHKWDVDEKTKVTSEVYKITDERRKFESAQNFLKDYFYREYETDSEPLTYALLHQNFKYSSMDFLVQKRVNPWFNQIDKLPEVKYSLPNINIGETFLYFESSTSFASFNKKASTAPVSPDEVSVTRLDTLNKVSLPARVSIFQVAPFVAGRETLYDKAADDENLASRVTFYSGVDLSTKFYRVFDVKSDFLNMQLDGLRHIITPTVGYAYNHDPTIPSGDLYQIDSIDAITASNAATLGLSNKLQTKRDGKSVDLLDCFLSSSYVFKPKAQDKSGSHISDILFEMKLLPYSWLRIQSDAVYKHSGSRSDVNYRKFTEANYEISFSLGKERSLGFSQRYQRQSGNELTAHFYWRLNPKWKFSVYQRYNLKDYRDSADRDISKGLLEQEFTVSRDLHCWVMDITVSDRGNEGATIFFLFRLKAFPEMEFGFNQSYRTAQSGAP